MQEACQTFRIKAPTKDVFDFLQDIEKAGRCIAGVKEIKVVSPTDSEWKTTITAGIISRTMDLKVHFDQIKPELISFTGEGRNIKFTGSLGLKPISVNETEAVFKVVINASGPLAQLIDLMMGHIAERLAKESVENIKKVLEPLRTVG